MASCGAVDALCAKLMSIEYMDVAEQSLEALARPTVPRCPRACTRLVSTLRTHTERQPRCPRACISLVSTLRTTQSGTIA